MHAFDRQTDGQTDVDSKTVCMLRSRTAKILATPIYVISEVQNILAQMDIFTTQKQAKSLPPDTFPGLKNYQRCRGTSLQWEGKGRVNGSWPLQLLILNSLMSGITCSIRYRGLVKAV